MVHHEWKQTSSYYEEQKQRQSLFSLWDYEQPLGLFALGTEKASKLVKEGNVLASIVVVVCL